MKLLWKYLRKNLFAALLLICALIAQIVLQIFKTNMVAEVVDCVSLSDDAGLVNSVLTGIGIRFLLIALGMVVAAVVAGVFAAIISTNIARDLRDDLYSHIMTFSMGEMSRFSIPSVISRCTDDVSTVRSFTEQFLTGALSTPFLIIGGLMGAWQQERSMLWILVLGVGLVLILFWIMISRMMPIVRQMVVQMDVLHRDSREGISGVQILKALNREMWSTRRISGAAEDLRITNERYSFIEAILLPSMFLVLNILNLVVIWFGAKNVSRPTMTAGTVFAFINYLYMIVSGVISGCIIGLQLPRVRVCIQRLREILDTKPEIRDPEQPMPIPENCDVSFEDVSFRYAQDGGDVVRHISFTAKQGEVTAIIGNTGCGKTTLMELIPRLHDTREGRVCIGGVDVRQFALRELRGVVGYVPQKALLFSGTIRSNIAMRDLSTEDGELERAATLSQALSFIRDKQDGFDDPIAQGGTNVSGGQRQRLTIARAVCGDPRILVLDDSSSALDYETDVRLREAIRSGEGNATVIIVSQRISSIRHADRIIVMRDGEVMGIGTHEELKTACPAYQDILRSQMEAV